MDKKTIEDAIFADVVAALGIKRTKDMYEPADWYHTCSSCGENTKGYRLKPEYVETINTPYLWICNDCYEELENDK